MTGRVDFRGQGRARMAGEDRGILHIYAALYAARASGRLLGAELCAPGGENIAHLLALAIQQRFTVPELLRMPFYHPVIEEGLRTALREPAGELAEAPEGPDLARCDSVPVESL